MKQRKIMLVIEDTGDDDNPTFNFYASGDIDRIQDPSVNIANLTAAEIWGSKLFSVCIDALKKSGVLKHVKNRTEGH